MERLLLGQLSKDLSVSEEQVLVLADLDDAPAKGRQQNTVTGLHTGLDQSTSLGVGDTGANSDNISLVELLGVLLRNVDTGSGLGLGLEALDQDTVEKRNKRLDRLDGRLEQVSKRTYQQLFPTRK